MSKLKVRRQLMTPGFGLVSVFSLAGGVNGLEHEQDDG